MINFWFLKFYINLGNKEVKKEVNVYLFYGFDYLCLKFRLLYWEVFLMRCMFLYFFLENFVVFVMEVSKFEKLWNEV